MKRLLLAIVLSLLAFTSPASAGTADEPEFQDVCDVTQPSQEDLDNATPPWTDICSGWFESTVTEEGADEITNLSLTIQLAGNLQGRVQDYSGSWDTEGCRYRLLHQEGLGEEDTALPQGIVVHSKTIDTLNITCGQPVPRPCEPGELSSTCYDSPPTTAVDLPDGAFSVNGNTAKWSIDFVGDLAEYADAHARGDILTETVILATPDVSSVAVSGLTYCAGSECGSVWSDHSYGDDHVIAG